QDRQEESDMAAGERWEYRQAREMLHERYPGGVVGHAACVPARGHASCVPYAAARTRPAMAALGTGRSLSRSTSRSTTVSSLPSIQLVTALSSTSSRRKARRSCS